MPGESPAFGRSRVPPAAWSDTRSAQLSAAPRRTDLQREREAGIARASLFIGVPFSIAMGMPQNEDYENRNLWMNESQESVSFLLQGSSKIDSLQGRCERVLEKLTVLKSGCLSPLTRFTSP